jgi:hypothetical protein
MIPTTANTPQITWITCTVFNPNIFVSPSYIKMLFTLPGLSETRAAPGAKKNGETSGPQNADRPAKRAFSAPPVQNAALLDPRAAALDQNEQYDYSQHSASNLDDLCTV